MDHEGGDPKQRETVVWVARLDLSCGEIERVVLPVNSAGKLYYTNQWGS
jgi:hypothetical protein